MTPPVSAVEAIEKAMEHATPGTWDVWEEKTPTKSDAIAEMAYQVENSDPFAEAVYLLNANGKCPATTGCGPTSAANAAYIAACSPDRMREVLALARQAEALKRRAEAAEALAERMRQEAQAHAMEVRTANSTIYEIYQVVSGGKGEPGNWHGAEPVRAKLEALQRENAELREALKPFARHKTADGLRGPDSLLYIPDDHPLLFNGLGNDARATVTVGDVRRARTLLKEEANAE